jgi:hypothetical protein
MSRYEVRITVAVLVVKWLHDYFNRDPTFLTQSDNLAHITKEIPHLLVDREFYASKCEMISSSGSPVWNLNDGAKSMEMGNVNENRPFHEVSLVCIVKVAHFTLRW